VLVLTGPKQPITGIVFSPDGKRLAARTPEPGMFWPKLTAPPAHVFDGLASHGVGNVEFLSGTHLIVGSQILRAYPVGWTKSERCPVRFYPRAYFSCSPTERIVVVRHANEARWSAWHIDKSAKWTQLWDLPSGAMVKPIFAPDGSVVYQLVHVRAREPRAPITNAVEAVDPRTGKLVSTVTLTGTYGDNSVISPDSNFLATCCDRTIAVVEMGSVWQEKLRITNTTKKHFTGIAFHPSGKYLAATSNDETVKLYDTTTWEVAHTFAWDIGKMRSVAFSRDGTLAAAGSDKGQIVVWDVDV
jgi:WD40 repeat protein